jgi:hypothetical protein
MYIDLEVYVCNKRIGNNLKKWADTKYQNYDIYLWQINTKNGDTQSDFC